MQQAKHRAARRPSADSAVLATTLLERFAAPRPATTGPRHGAPATGPESRPATGRIRTLTAVADAPVDGSPFGAARHAAPPRPRGAVPGPRVIQPAATPLARVRPQPVGTALSVLGAAAAVTAVVAPPPTAVETTGSLAPVQGTAPDRAPSVAPALGASGAQALADEPTIQVGELVVEVTGEMQRVARPYTTVVNATPAANPKPAASPSAAMRRAAMSTALGKLGKPYRWGAVGPNAFDCSGLVKFSFGAAGRSLPRTSRAMATVGIPVRKADLQPGDLVFFYKPVSHVGIYIGNGKIVHASRSGQPVKISNMASMQFTSARRIV